MYIPRISIRRDPLGMEERKNLPPTLGRQGSRWVILNGEGKKKRYPCARGRVEVKLCYPLAIIIIIILCPNGFLPDKQGGPFAEAKPHVLVGLGASFHNCRKRLPPEHSV